MKKIILVFGTRPEAIKMCPLVKEFKKYLDKYDAKVLVTGQHRQMLDQVLKVFNIVPDYDLSIMKDNQTLFDITTNVLNGCKGIFEKEKPNLVLVHGDTTTSFAAGLAAFYLQIPVGHVEAGLRTYNIYSPYPEEFNRQTVDSFASYMFAPTETSKQNLIKEGKDPSKIFVTGNTIIDVMRITTKEDYNHPELEWASDSRLILITVHRRENLGEPMRNVFKAIRRVLEEHSDIKVLYPIHINPAIRKVAQEELSGLNRIRIIEPLDVVDMHNFEIRCYLCLTDSGGIQEECTSCGKPVLVTRDISERLEGIESGTIKLVGTSEETIYQEFTKLLDNQDEYNRMSKASNSYGDGHACEKIVRILE